MHLRQALRCPFRRWPDALLLLLLASGCANPDVRRSEQGRLLRDAERYASELKDRDRLPGYGGTEHGHMIASAPWRAGRVSYPAQVTIRAWKDGDDSTYVYSLVKDSAESSWHLVDAARLDAQGNPAEPLSTR